MVMRISRDQPEEGEITLTPLIDVVFLLLIFFMVSTTFDRTQAIEMALPTAETGGTREQGERLLLELRPQGRYRLNDEPLEAGELQAALAASDRGIPMVIQAHAQASSQDLVHVLDIARKLGITQLSVEVKPKTASSKARP